MRFLKANIALGFALLSAPMLVELGAAALGNKPGIGLDVLLYWPFDFALPLLALTLFVLINGYLFDPSRIKVVLGVATGILLTLFWFFLTFLAVGQLHLSLGGKL
ncbi:MAG: hypothetical protein JSS05_04705 [Proteobacteria bacterium]|nr:hypothetical protein [Pseudomonadota bacterium]